MASENLKKFVLLLAQSAMQGEKSFADGVQLKDFLDFYPQILQIPAISFPEMGKEVKARTPLTNKEVEDYLIEQLNLQNDWAEALVEQSFTVVVGVDNLITLIKNRPVKTMVKQAP